MAGMMGGVQMVQGSAGRMNASGLKCIVGLGFVWDGGDNAFQSLTKFDRSEKRAMG